MRYSLLEYINCSYCGGDLTCMVPPQEDVATVNKQSYVVLDVLSEFPRETPLVEMIEHFEEEAEALERDDSIEVKNGLLICGECGHWFPIYDFIPELLPDHLRKWEKDAKFLESLKHKLPEDIFKELSEKMKIFASQVFAVEDYGSNYKKSEISIKTKVTEEDFFGPGFSSPFNPGNPDYTMHLIRRLGNILPLLELKKDDVVLDMGAGYAWTTEWLKKMGAESIGIDICRTYLDIGLKRMGEKRPHLVVGDVENLPIKANCLNAVLCYDAFHHIPNRKKCLGNFFKSLKDYGNIALAEPGGTHEFEKISKEVMDKYGILEKGMELDDINDYCDGLKVLPPEQHYILKVQKDDRDKPLSLEFMHTHSYVDCNFFVVKKRLGERDLVPDGSKFKRKVKKGLKRLLKRVVVKLLH